MSMQAISKKDLETPLVDLSLACFGEEMLGDGFRGEVGDRREATPPAGDGEDSGDDDVRSTASISQSLNLSLRDRRTSIEILRDSEATPDGEGRVSVRIRVSFNLRVR